SADGSLSPPLRGRPDLVLHQRPRSRARQVRPEIVLESSVGIANLLRRPAVHRLGDCWGGVCRSLALLAAALGAALLVPVGAALVPAGLLRLHLPILLAARLLELRTGLE